MMRVLRRGPLLVAVLTIAATVVPTVAQAKGVVDVTVRIETDGNGKTLRFADNRRASDLTLATQFHAGVEGSSLGAVELPAPTDERLGPRYVAVFRVQRRPDEVLRIRQDLYPFAELGPLVFTPPDQGWDFSGWRRVGWELIDLFGELGVAPPADARWKTAFTDARDFALTIPSSWRRAESSATSRAAGGVEPILAVGSNPVAMAGPGGCAGVPTSALDVVGPTDAFVAVLRYRRPARWTADTYMPDQFGERTPWQPLPAECADSAPPASVRTLRFPLHGARLQVVVAVGTAASAVTNAHVYRVLDSLRAGPG
jgi:hypothetical protein